MHYVDYITTTIITTYSHHAWAGTADSKSKSKEFCPKGLAKSFKF